MFSVAPYSEKYATKEDGIYYLYSDMKPKLKEINF